ncbi:MAG TPA: Sir2 family NAD-dependent protein deacetylase [Noviherbaspirillum sp.]|jgi:NAD-dependent SIR2 family protein deacetylase|uniref:SIR2 family NAD-dependent protein deacylase n=1 Tax=Noviherbaspirillum sp. TaxID=1926288 RepID=UPI002DDD2CD5|nr:Sir2 family NAD-dependent protein deacetylase [Noviherbaspirillum sp.]HEV2609702.1 Sir2 family NAD-dependent protein deacetylase [Noviherbaspirillum sp.]
MTNLNSVDDACFAAADLISQADGLLITAGAGMGIDSGLPDFRGDHGFWRAYPALGHLGMRFHEVANPKAFESMPEVAWGFYGHRLNLYRAIAPHAGFTMLLAMAGKMPNGGFVFTSNVDGHFQKSGFPADRVAECHGSIHHLQCFAGCGKAVWSADGFVPEVDAEQCRLLSDLPRCPKCGALARPNILMFGDWDWNDERSARQEARLNAWFMRLQQPVVIELGAGTAIPTVRLFGEQAGCPLIRINPAEPEVGLHRDIAVPLGALEGIRRIAAMLQTPGA